MSDRISGLCIIPIVFMVTIILASAVVSKAAPLTQDEALSMSRDMTMTLVKETKKTLKSNLGDGDFLKAVKGCSEVAPSIAQKYIDETGYYIRRVSLKYRNPDDSPDQYEKAVLEEFDGLRGKGKMVDGYEDYKVVEEEGKTYFRYMKPLITKKLCLNCHGSEENIPVVVKEFLNTTYPEDLATGFRVDDVRGAVSIKIPVE